MKLIQMVMRNFGFGALALPQIADTLNLTEKQNDELVDKQIEVQKELRELVQKLWAELEERALKEVLTSEQKSELDMMTGKAYSPKMPNYYEQMLRQQLRPSKTSKPLCRESEEPWSESRRASRKTTKTKRRIKVHGQLAPAWLQSLSRFEPFFRPDGNATRVAAGRFRFRCRTAISVFQFFGFRPETLRFLELIPKPPPGFHVTRTSGTAGCDRCRGSSRRC